MQTCADYRARYKERVKQSWRKSILKRKYGTTPADVEKLLLEQDNRCLICGNQLEGTPRIDHCHLTLRIRGLLCHHCNVGLGHFRDSPERLRRAASYLESSDAGC